VTLSEFSDREEWGEWEAGCSMQGAAQPLICIPAGWVAVLTSSWGSVCANEPLQHMRWESVNSNGVMMGSSQPAALQCSRSTLPHYSISCSSLTQDCLTWAHVADSTCMHVPRLPA
jgi:hypothetical protein